MKQLYQLLVDNCENAQDLKTRVEVVNEQINAVGAKLVKEYQDNLGKQNLSTLELKAQDGKGKEVEQMVIDLLKDEPLSTAQTILHAWMITHDAFVRKQLLESKPTDLKVEFK